MKLSQRCVSSRMKGVTSEKALDSNDEPRDNAVSFDGLASELGTAGIKSTTWPKPRRYNFLIN